MSSASTVRSLKEFSGASIRECVDREVDDLLNALPDPDQLTPAQQRGIIARYTAALEGNFIYWMTGAYLSVGAAEARSIICENLTEEIRDSHPLMLRKFAMASHALPTDSDGALLYEDVTKVRLFVGLLSGVRTVIMMTFFEEFIQGFMAYLADLAGRRGSAELEYTSVHGICDIAHTEGLFRALAAEMEFNPPEPELDLFEGVNLLKSLILTIIDIKS